MSNLERERKFILTDFNIIKNLPYKNIQQGYLMLNRNDGRQFRIRITDWSKAEIAYKYPLENDIKKEFEYKIDLFEGMDLYKDAEFKLEKIRYIKELPSGHIAEIDIYPNGLGVVEIEYGDVFPPIPKFCGEDITNNRKYSNIVLAMESGL